MAGAAVETRHVCERQGATVTDWALVYWIGYALHFGLAMALAVHERDDVGSRVFAVLMLPFLWPLMPVPALVYGYVAAVKAGL